MSDQNLPAIYAKDLIKSYGSFRALKGIDLQVHSGEIFGFLGPNGAGKTTAIRCMLDMIRRDSGAIEIFGKDPQIDSVAVRDLCGYLPGELRLDENASVKSILNYLRRLRQGGNDCSENILQLASRLDLSLESKIKNLSKGNKQKLGIIAAFMHNPKLLLLDEPTSGLDPLVQQTVLELVKEAKQSGATIFFSSHVLAEVQSVADRVAIIKNGEIVEVGVTSSLLSKRSWRAKIKFGSDDSGRKAMIEALKDTKVLKVSDDGRIYDIGIEGDVDSFIKCIAAFEVDYLEINKPNLEEIFLSYYGDYNS